MNDPATPATALRCHLLIGPPASGKTSLASLLAPLLGSPGQPAAILATDAIRAELYGDPNIQGNWSEIEVLLHARLCFSVAAGIPVILDATHALRPWRLAVTQRLTLPAPVEWIGWRLTTPLDTCLAWNRRRERQVSEAVLRRFAAALGQRVFAPNLSEGFAALLAVDPSAPEHLEQQLAKALAQLGERIRTGRSRDSERCRALHGYSRLLDLERLLWLLQLLGRFPDLAPSDGASREELEAIRCPLPEGPLPLRAAAFLAGLRGDAYADPDALAADLDWLAAQGFLSPGPSTTLIEPPPPTPATLANRGGWPPEADPVVFRRVFTLLRRCLREPFEDPPAGVAGHTLRRDVLRILVPYGLCAADAAAHHRHPLGSEVLRPGREWM